MGAGQLLFYPLHVLRPAEAELGENTLVWVHFRKTRLPTGKQRSRGDSPPAPSGLPTPSPAEWRRRRPRAAPRRAAGEDAGPEISR